MNDDGKEEKSVLRPIDEFEVPSLIEWFQKEIPKLEIDDKLLEFWKKNNDIIHIVERSNDEIGGALVFYPISKQCDFLIMNGTISRVNEVSLEHIVSYDEIPYSLILRAAIGKNRQEKKSISALVESSFVDAGFEEVERFLMEPATHDGKRLCKRLGLKPVGAGNIHGCLILPNGKQG